MDKRELYKRIAIAIGALENCKRTHNDVWIDRWQAEVERLQDLLPHGSGFDSGTKIDLDRSNSEKIVLVVEFHHMDQNGYYCGWSGWDVIVTPSFAYNFTLSHELTYDDTDKQTECEMDSDDEIPEYENFTDDNFVEFMLDTIHSSLSEMV